MKTKVMLILFILVSVGLCADGVLPIGEGTEETPYQIETLDNLLYLSTNDYLWESGLYFRQTADIDASDTQNWNDGEGFIPIGYDLSNSFSGSYDGDGYSISNLYINRPSTLSVGLFGYTFNATIENASLIDVNVTGFDFVGGLVGHNSSSTVSNCNCTGSVSGSGRVGALVGRNTNFSTINNSYCTGSVTSTGNDVGGFVGCNYYSTVSNSYSTGSVNGTQRVGGLVGGNYSSSAISNSYSTGSVNGTQRVGGLVGNNESSSVSNSYGTGSVNGLSDVGGLVGRTLPSSTVSNSFYDYETTLINEEHVITIGAISNEMFTEWLNNNLSLDVTQYYTQVNDNYLISSIIDFKNLLGFAYDSTFSFILNTDIDLFEEQNFHIPYLGSNFDGNNHTINNLYINIPSTRHVGLFGIAYNAAIENVRLIDANVTGDTCVGGLVGLSYSSTVIASYTTGSVSGAGDYVGGIVGVNYLSSTAGSYSTCSVVGTDIIGGLVGQNDESTVSNCYSTGSVSGSEYVGGLVGDNYFDSSIINSSSMGTVSGIENVGGLVGHEFASYVTNSFWDTETSGITTSEGGTGKTTAEMIDVATFTYLETIGLDSPWDFFDNPFDDIANEDLWDIDSDLNNGYPYLTSLPFVDVEEEMIHHSSLKTHNLKNYPNPFNPSTIIFFSIAENAENTKVEIYNIKGQLVDSLPVIQRESEGNITWDASKCSSGVYFYKLNIADSSIKKMVLLK